MKLMASGSSTVLCNSEKAEMGSSVRVEEVVVRVDIEEFDDSCG